MVFLLVGRLVLFLVLVYFTPVSDLLWLFLAFAAAGGAAGRAGGGRAGAGAFLSLVPFVTGFMILGPSLVVIVNQFVYVLWVGWSLDFLGSGVNGAKSKVDAGDNFTLLVVVKFRAEDNLVGGDGGLDGVALKASGKDNSADGRAGQEVAHIVAGGFPVGDSGKSKVVSGPLFAVAEVLALDDVDHLTLSCKLGLRSEVGHTLEGVFGQRSDVVKDFTFAIDGVFHNLVNSGVLVVLRNHVKLGADKVLALCVDLELTHN